MTDEEIFPLDDSDVERAEQFRSKQQTAMLAILVLDMVGSTSLREDVGELPFEQMRRNADDHIRELIAKRVNGEVIKGTGDGLLAVFSEADTCVRCALDIQRYLSADSAVRVRIGLDVGQVSTESTGVSRDVFGRHVNRAARLEERSEAGHILCSLPLWDSASGWLRHNKRIAWRNHGAFNLTGFTEPQDVFEVFDASLMSPLSTLNGAKSDKSRPPPAGGLSARPIVRRLQALFLDDIDEGGAYIGSVEDSVSEKAAQRRNTILKRIRATLAARFAVDAVIQSNSEMLKFPSGTVVSQYGKTWGSSSYVRYTISTTVALDAPFDPSLLDAMVAKLGPYKHLRFAMAGPLAVRDIFEVSRSLDRTVEELSDDEITLRLGSLWVNAKTTDVETQLTVSREFGMLRPDLHLLIRPDDLVRWVTGSDDVAWGELAWAT